MEGLSPEVETINNRYPEGDIYDQNMQVVTFLEAVEGSGNEIDALLCDIIYNEEDYYIFSWSITDLDVLVQIV